MDKTKFLILVILFFKIEIILAETEEKWFCSRENLCVLNNNEINGSKSFKSQNICRLSCGYYGSLWPHPTLETTISNDRVEFNPNSVKFNIEAPNGNTEQFLSDNSQIFMRNIRKECKNLCNLTDSKDILVKIIVNSKETTLNWNTDESSQIVITKSEIAVFVRIKAETIFGARHSLETLSQLITANVGNGLVMVSRASINDKPLFHHRGLLLDTARNFIPIRNIKNVLDGMSTSKLNVFHWHVTDSQSFPLEILKIPELHRLGSYSPENVYSRADTIKIISYARLRGIRVIFEIDAPSHAGNGWQFGPMAGFGNLAVCINKQPWRKYCIEPPCGQLNPVNDYLYIFLKNIFEELSEINGIGETIHMGGDEVFLDCWNATEEIVKAMKLKGMDRSTESFLKLWSGFHEKNFATWNEIKTKQLNNNYNIEPVIIWSSHLTKPNIINQYLPKEKYIIQTWVESSDPLIEELLKQEYRLIISTKDAWYLDHGFWGRTQYYNWRKVYDNQLHKHNLILGGEVCMWSEYVDENSLDARIWPRAGAAAERLWSNPNTTSKQAEQRFVRYRERLITRGIKPDAIMPKWCSINDDQCN